MQCYKAIPAMLGGTCNYQFLPRGGSAKDQLSGAELAGLLSGLGTVAVDLAYALYASDDQAQCKLRAHMQLYAVKLAVDEGWESVRGQPTVTRMGILSVFELISPGVCSLCHGSGVYQAHECDLCRGFGRMPSSGRQRANFIVVSRMAWQRLWADRYARIYNYLLGIDADVRNAVIRNSSERV